jgi:hypothetical protein
MGLLLACVIVSMAGGQTPAVEWEDGFYLISREPNAPTVVTQAGKEVRIGQRAEVEVTSARLRSRDNWNERFSLALTTPWNEGWDSVPRRVLIAEGKGFEQCSAGASEGKSCHIGFSVDTREDADLLARYFAVKPHLRRHPGHQLAVRFVPLKQEFAPGEDVGVSLEIENVGDEPVVFTRGGQYRGMRDNQFGFAAYRQGESVPDVGSTSTLGGISTDQRLEPGERFTSEIGLGKWFAFEEPGRYEVLGWYDLELWDPATDSLRAGHFAIWEDLATAWFTVRIAKPK